MKTRRFEIPLPLMAALMVLLVASMAGASLWRLRLMHSHTAHAAAAKSALDQGGRIVAYLSQQPAVRNGDEETGWGQFSRAISSIHAIENGLQYVSVRKDGIAVFNEHTKALDGDRSLSELPRADAAADSAIQVGRKVLTVAGGSVPVVTFTLDFTGDDGRPRSIEIGLKKDIVKREEGSMADAIDSMFKVSLATMAVSFSACVLLVVVVMRREAARERRMREEEHLVFAGVMANGIVHDFRNPMSSMRLDVQMLRKEASKTGNSKHERLIQLSDRIQTTMDRMDNVFQEFFYLSRPDMEQDEFVDLAALIRECASILSPGLEQAGVRVESEFPETQTFVCASRAMLRRALINVMVNAKQFSKSGDTIRARLSESEKSAIIEVSDNGPGVPASERDRIFDMFVTTRPGGTGLGLFLARMAVEKAGGSIKVSDGPAGGACFTIALPLARLT